MAELGEEGCNLVQDRQLHHDVLGILQKWIEGQDKSESGLLDVPEGQPLRLRLLRAILEIAGGPG